MKTTPQKIKAVLALPLALGIFASQADAATYGNGNYDNTNNIQGATGATYGSGTTWANSYTENSINNAIQTQAASNGGQARMQSGTYNCDNSIYVKEDVMIRGQGRNNTYVKRTGDVNPGLFYDGSNQDDVLLFNFTAEGNGGNSSSVTNNNGIYYGFRAWRLKIDRVRVQNFTQGYLGDNSRHVLVTGAEFYTNGHDNLTHNMYFRRVGNFQCTGTVSSESDGDGLKSWAHRDDPDYWCGSNFIITGNSRFDNNGKTGAAPLGWDMVRIEDSRFNDNNGTNWNNAGIHLGNHTYNGRYSDVINNEVRYNTSKGIGVNANNNFWIEGNWTTSNGDNYDVRSSYAYRSDQNTSN